MEDQFNLDEIALQMFSDLKTEVVKQFESQHRLMSRCFHKLKTISTCFLPGINPPVSSKRRQWQMILGAEKESGKRKGMESKEEPQATRITRARCKLQAEVEVGEEPMNVAATESPSACPKMAVSLQTGDKDSSSALPYPVIAVLSQAGGTGKSSLLPSPVIAFLSQTEGTCHSSPFPSPVCDKGGLSLFLSQTGGRGGLSLFPSQTGSRGGLSLGHGEEIVTTEAKLNSLDPVCEGSNDMDCKRIPPKDTPKMVQECAEGWPSPRPFCGYSADMKDTEQSEALDAIETIQMLHTSNIIEELSGNEDTETPISQVGFEQTSIRRPSSFNNDAGKQSADLAEQKCLGRNEVFSRNLPSYTSYAKNKEGSLSCTPLPRFQADGMSSVCTSVSYLLDKTHLHATPSNGRLFGSSFEVTSPQDCGQQGDSKIVPADDTHYTATNKIGKRFGSSVRKKDSGTPNVRAGGRFASQISPRISQKPSNILCNAKSFIPLVQQKKAAASVMTGKRDIKVKALKAAGVAKRIEEKREQACNIKKSISCGMVRNKPVGCTLQSQAGTFVIALDVKLRRPLLSKDKLEQENLRKLEEKRKKDEERKKNAAEVAANKKKKEEMDKRDREEKRRRLEEAQKQQKELEEQLRAEKEAKEQRRRALDGCKRKRKAMEEKAKKQRRIEKEREAAERRRRIEDDAKSNKFASKDAKHMQKVHQHNETTQAQNAYAGKVLSMSTSCAKSAHGTEGQSMLGSIANTHLSLISNINIESYEISPYKGSDEEDNDDRTPGKPIPLWARKENLISHTISQQYIDPDEIFAGARTCSLNEVFESNGTNSGGDFKRRSYSGEWLNDCFTWKEEYQYKLQMGYINKG